MAPARLRMGLVPPPRTRGLPGGPAAGAPLRPRGRLNGSGCLSLFTAVADLDRRVGAFLARERFLYAGMGPGCGHCVAQVVLNGVICSCWLSFHGGIGVGEHDFVRRPDVFEQERIAVADLDQGVAAS